MKNKVKYASLVFVSLLFLYSCKDSPSDNTIYNPDEASQGYTLFAPNESKSTYLIDMEGNIVHSWSHSAAGGYAVYLLESGNIMRSAHASNSTFNGGGSAGLVEEVDWEGNVVWQFQYSNSQHLSHHDIEPMPNGNVLLIAWEFKTASDAKAAGRKLNAEIWPDHIVEVDRSTSQVIWEWHAWDHLVQDYDAAKSNYGVVGDHPELIDVNMPVSGSGGPGQGDWMHMNGISFNAQLDQIVFSSHFFSEVYIIDHSTTTDEAKGHTGGLYGKGGDILYRWGKPSNYDASGSSYISVCHCPMWIPSSYAGGGNITIFNNGSSSRSSSILEIALPSATGNYPLSLGSAYGPAEPIWTYSNGSGFYSPNTGCAQRLSNGNTLITDPDNGYLFEVNSEGTKVWDYTYRGQIARSIRYENSYAGLKNIFN